LLKTIFYIYLKSENIVEYGFDNYFQDDNREAYFIKEKQSNKILGFALFGSELTYKFWKKVIKV